MPRLQWRWVAVWGARLSHEETRYVGPRPLSQPMLPPLLLVSPTELSALWRSAFTTVIYFIVKWQYWQFIMYRFCLHVFHSCIDMRCTVAYLQNVPATKTVAVVVLSADSFYQYYRTVRFLHYRSNPTSYIPCCSASKCFTKFPLFFSVRLVYSVYFCVCIYFVTVRFVSFNAWTCL